MIIIVISHIYIVLFFALKQTCTYFNLMHGSNASWTELKLNGIFSFNRRLAEMDSAATPSPHPRPSRWPPPPLPSPLNRTRSSPLPDRLHPNPRVQHPINPRLILLVTLVPTLSVEATPSPAVGRPPPPATPLMRLPILTITLERWVLVCVFFFMGTEDVSAFVMFFCVFSWSVYTCILSNHNSFDAFADISNSLERWVWGLFYGDERCKQCLLCCLCMFTISVRKFCYVFSCIFMISYASWSTATPLKHLRILAISLERWAWGLFYGDERCKQCLLCCPCIFIIGLRKLYSDAFLDTRIFFQNIYVQDISSCDRI